MSELRHKWLRSGWHHTAKTRRLVSNFVTTTPWWIAWRVCQNQAKEACDEEPWARCEKLSKTLRTLPDQAGPGAKDERWIDLWFQVNRPVSRLPAKSPNSNCPKPRVPETPSYQSGRASDRPVEAFKRRCPGEAQRFGKSRNGGCPRTRKTRYTAEDIGSDASSAVGPSGTE